MKYTIVIEDSANADLRQSYEWGVRVWGKAQAQQWFRHTIREIKALTNLPKRCPIASDTEEFDETIRQLVVGRYRILFTIRGKKVHILHVRGAYFDDESEEE
jgi:plasmid stabilization system protein ParE